MAGTRKSKPELGLYWCSGCRQLLDQSLFSRLKNTTGKPVCGKCKKCSSESARSWAKRNPERAKETTIKHHQTEQAKEKQKAWRAQNKEYVAKKLREWRDMNRDAVNEIARRSRKKNIDVALYHNRQRAILKSTAMPAWANKSEIRKIYAEARKMTKVTGEVHHVDHIIPIKGKNVCGLHVETNLQILTASENLRKFNKYEVLL